jgi:hypothetical protein
LIGPDEGDRVLADVQEAVKVKRKAPKAKGGASKKPEKKKKSRR